MRPDVGRTVIDRDAAQLRRGRGTTVKQTLGEASDLGQEPLIYLHIDDEILVFSWGKPHQLGTACYWVEQTRHAPRTANYRLGCSLYEEVAACLLGGHGVRAAVGLAAFEAVRAEGLLQEGASPSRNEIEAVLRRPLEGLGQRPIRYRFAQQRAARLEGSLKILARGSAPTDPLALRDWLLELPGIGPKTAAWITRNHTGTDDVAIIDIHLRRAGLAAGFFLPRWRLPRDYSRFELAFVSIARLGGVSAAALDAYIWDELQYLGDAGSAVLGREIAAFG
jgi:N-glycosylase/DNA lyase